MIGHYVAFEGIEGAGKSTVIERLSQRLSEGGEEVLVVREPGGTEVGEGIRTLLLDAPHPMAPWTEALLFAASRAQLASEVVAPALGRGAWVLSDRTVYSSLAYQGSGRDLGVEAVWSVNAAGLGEVWPEVVVLLRLDPEEGLRRQNGSDRIGSEDLAFHRVVSDSFDKLSTQEPERFVVVEAQQRLDAIVDEVHEALMSRWSTP